jgi:hypothetical protein
MFVMLIAVAMLAAVRGLWSPCGLSMLTALNPVAERARGHRFAMTAAWYVLGAACGGAVLGAGCAVAAFGVARLALPVSATWTIALAAAALAVLSDGRVGGWSLPDHPRQVDVRWLTRYRRWVYAGGYGVQIGTGFATYIMTAGVYVTAVLAALTADPAQAFVGGIAFGLTRGLGILVAAPARTPETLRRVVALVDSWAGASAILAAAGSLMVAAVAGWQIDGPALGAGVAAALLLVTHVGFRPVPTD